MLPIIKFPFDKGTLPERGIYFFYEEREKSDHGNGLNTRIVRIGTDKKDNFRFRISEHFLINESKMNFNQYQPKPSDRSIFRKNIGRTILNRAKNDYLDYGRLTLPLEPTELKQALKEYSNLKERWKSKSRK